MAGGAGAASGQNTITLSRIGKSPYEVVASERVTLYGLNIAPRRMVSYGRVAPQEAREIFFARGAGQWPTEHPGAVLPAQSGADCDIEQLEHKARRQDVLVDEQTLFDFYAERVPAEGAPPPALTPGGRTPSAATPSCCI